MDKARENMHAVGHGQCQDNGRGTAGGWCQGDTQPAGYAHRRDNREQYDQYGRYHARDGTQHNPETDHHDQEHQRQQVARIGLGRFRESIVHHDCTGQMHFQVRVISAHFFCHCAHEFDDFRNFLSLVYARHLDGDVNGGDIGGL